VNEAFVRKYLPEKNPLGRIFFLGDPSKAENLANPIQIVGVAADAHYRDVRSEPPPTAYVPFEQHLDNLQQTAFLVRTALPPLSLAEQIRKAVAKVDRTVPLAFVRTEQQVIDRSLGAERLSATLVSSLGIVAALLAAIGLYGVISYSVSRRTAEIGVRLALGATRRDVVRLVVGECLWFVLAGLAVGVPAALGLTRLVEKTLFGVKATDPATYAIASILMILICAFAALIPARRAARIEPVIALKYE
jgi:ABC-type antimicrobial peptide transport system permease subunit